jgi:hypothetical protein
MQTEQRLPSIRTDKLQLHMSVASGIKRSQSYYAIRVLGPAISARSC